MKAQLPLTALEAMQSGSWKGTDLIRLSNPLSRPSAREVANAYTFLKPAIVDSPSKVWVVKHVVVHTRADISQQSY